MPYERGALQQFLERCERGSPVAVETIGNRYWIVDEIEAAESQAHDGRDQVSPGAHQAARHSRENGTVRARTILTLGIWSWLWLTAVASATEIPDALNRKLAEFPGAERGHVMSIGADAVARAFPGYGFYVLRFRQYPVALVPPPPLTANTLFVVEPDGSVDRIPDAKGLEQFFRARLAPVQTEAQATDVTLAWLSLDSEFHQDGFFRLSVPRESLRVASGASGGLEATGTALVSPEGGNSGDITATLTFDSAGTLIMVTTRVALKRGIRPICQATKLLDPDPIVRGMAEQDLLVMGRSAQAYLEAQRAKAGAELRRAIDHIWQRILLEER
jgi:hypothetical protein